MFSLYLGRKLIGEVCCKNSSVGGFSWNTIFFIVLSITLSGVSHTACSVSLSENGIRIRSYELGFMYLSHKLWMGTPYYGRFTENINTLRRTVRLLAMKPVRVRPIAAVSDSCLSVSSLFLYCFHWLHLLDISVLVLIKIHLIF